MLAAEQVDAQMALDQTVTGTNGQIYKTIAFANGSSTNNPSYNFTGPKNIDVGTSDSFASQPSFWRSNGSGGEPSLIPLQLVELLHQQLLLKQ